MPIYEFVCLSCGNDFEKLQSFSETSSPHCPACQSDQVRRRLSSPAIHFKGSGWYVTDSKSGKNGKSTAESPAKSGEKSGDADKKPASGDGEHKGEAAQKGEPASEKATKSETSGATSKDSA
jgi:putative FmdB family regulatory protein